MYAMDTFIETMVPDESPSCTPNTPVATLAFIDLETTGLPFDVGKRNVQITELSILAVDRSDFENDPSLRVANKINLYIRPRSTISHGAMAITGLYNDTLEKQKPFDSTVPQIIDLFFSRLRSPICLLAHNGKRFDFPVLQAEMKRLGATLPVDLMCADTLEGFRSFGLVLPNVISADRIESSPSKDKCNNDATETNNTDNDVEQLLSKNIEEFQDINIICEKHIITAQTSDNSTLQHGSLLSRFGYKTPEKTSEKTECPILPKTKRTKSSNNISTPKRKLFAENNLQEATKNSDYLPQNDTVKPAPKKRPQFSLEKLYLHYFGHKPEGCHHALSDCINLCRVCQNISDSFLPWLDEKQIPFANTLAMW